MSTLAKKSSDPSTASVTARKTATALLGVGAFGAVMAGLSVAENNRKVGELHKVRDSGKLYTLSQGQPGRVRVRSSDGLNITVDFEKCHIHTPSGLISFEDYKKSYTSGEDLLNQAKINGLRAAFTVENYEINKGTQLLQDAFGLTAFNRPMENAAKSRRLIESTFTRCEM